MNSLLQLIAWKFTVLAIFIFGFWLLPSLHSQEDIQISAGGEVIISSSLK